MKVIKKIKRKVINKCKFSKKLNERFLEPLKAFEYKEGNNFEIINPLLYCDKKIAINISYPIKGNDLLEVLKNILFPFDLFINNSKIKGLQKKCYLDNVYQFDLFDNFAKLKKYDYVINITSDKALKCFESGFMESVLSVLSSSRGSYLSIGKEKFLGVEPYKHRRFLEFISGNLRLEDLFFEKDIDVSSNFIFMVSNYLDLFNNPSGLNNKLLFSRLLFLKSNSAFQYTSYFEKINFNQKPKNHFYETSYQQLYSTLKKYETITFDIFDTLITRKIVNPDDLFIMMEKESSLKFSKPFIEIRKEAENKAREDLKKDVSIHDIYKKMKEINKFTEKEIDALKKLEIDLEYRFTIPKKDMIKLYNQLLKDGKNIDLISDMYLSIDIVKKMLKKNKITNYRKLYLSCDQNMRKDTGDMWECYFKNNEEKTIHLGDNYQSDYIEVLKRGKMAIKVLNSKDLIGDFSLSNNIDDQISLGILFNEILFNSPFSYKEAHEDLKFYGRKFLAPIFYTFFNWFTKVNTAKSILFVSREGYYLQKIYKDYCKIFKVNEIKNEYFLTSRRAATLASSLIEEDLIALLSLQFDGTIAELFSKRYSISVDNKKIISLPKDKKLLEKIVIKNASKILQKASNERSNYLKYITTNFPLIKKEPTAIIDLGYSGTAQYHLSKILDTKLEGYYFALTNKLLPKTINCKIEGCFNVNGDIVDEESLFYRKSLFLESFLSAPEGQLIKFTKDGPSFTDSTFNKEKNILLEQIYLSVREGLEDILKINVKDFTINSIVSYYGFLCQTLENCSGDLARILYVDDDFCTNGEKYLDLLNKRV